MSEPSTDVIVDNRPMWQSPWFVAFVAGAITITLLRDCTRRVPDAPVALGAVPEWAMQSLDGSSQSSSALRGSVYILAFGASNCTSPSGPLSTDEGAQAACGVATEAVEELRTELAKKKGDAVLVALDVAPAWQQALELVKELAKLGMRTVDQPWDLGFILVDAQGQCRGFYGLHEEGRDEVLHRSQHVVRDMRAGTASPPEDVREPTESSPSTSSLKETP